MCCGEADKLAGGVLTQHLPLEMRPTPPLLQGKSVFVPYRDSKCTRLLKDSLGGPVRPSLWPHQVGLPVGCHGNTLITILPLPSPQSVWSELRGLLQHPQVCRRGQTDQDLGTDSQTDAQTHAKFIFHILACHMSVLRLHSLVVSSALPHMSRYKTVMEKLQREIAELKCCVR